MSAGAAFLLYASVCACVCVCVCLRQRVCLKVGFHYPSSRAENSARELGCIF